MKKLLIILFLVPFLSKAQDQSWWRRYEKVHIRYLAGRFDSLYLIDGSQGNGKILSSLSNGKATWIDQSSIVGAVPTLLQVYAGQNYNAPLTHSVFTDISNKNYTIGGNSITVSFNDSTNRIYTAGARIELNPDNPTSTSGLFVNNLTIGGAADRIMVGNSSTSRVDYGQNGYGILFSSSSLILDTTVAMNKLGAQVVSGIKNFTSLQKLTAGLNLSSTTAPLQLNGSAGTAGEVLTSAGAGATPTWASSGGGITIGTTTVSGGTNGFLLGISGGKVSSVDPSSIVTGLPYWNLAGSTSLGVNVDVQGNGNEVKFTNDNSTIFSNAPNTFYFDNSDHTAFVGINVVAPTANLDVAGTINLAASASAIIYNDGTLIAFGDINDAVNGTKVQVGAVSDIITMRADNGFQFVNGTMTIDNLSGTGTRAVLAASDGSLSAPVSDRNSKENIMSLRNGLGIVMNLDPKTFYMRDQFKKQYGSNQQVGFIAQDVQAVMPNSVFMNTAGISKGLMTYNEIDLLPVLWKAVQQQQSIIESMQEEIFNLKKKN